MAMFEFLQEADRALHAAGFGGTLSGTMPVKEQGD